jgi:hypothetical protein
MDPFLQPFAILVAILSGPGCDTTIHQLAGDAPEPPICGMAEGHSDFAFLSDNVFVPHCAMFTQCHSGGNPPARLSLTASLAYSDLVGVDAFTVAGWKRVVPGDPTASYLLVRLGAATGPIPDGGMTMPPQSPLLCSGLLEATRRWIAAGAPQ